MWTGGLTSTRVFKIVVLCELWSVGCWALWNDRNAIREGKMVPSVDVKSNWAVDYLESFLNV